MVLCVDVIPSALRRLSPSAPRSGPSVLRSSPMLAPSLQFFVDVHDSDDSLWVSTKLHSAIQRFRAFKLKYSCYLLADA